MGYPGGSHPPPRHVPWTVSTSADVLWPVLVLNQGDLIPLLKIWADDPRGPLEDQVKVIDR